MSGGSNSAVRTTAGIDAHSPRIAAKHGDHRRIGETARLMHVTQKAALALDDRHPMQPDLAAGGRDAAHRAHQRIDAGRQAFSYVGTRIAAGLEPPDHARDAELAQNVAEHHRGDDIAASGIEKHDAPQLRVRAARLEEIDKGLGRLSFDHAVGNDDVGTMPAALAGLQGRDMETHRLAVLLRRRRGWRTQRERDRRRDSRKRNKPPDAGGR